MSISMPNLSPHMDETLEWWFFHGFVEGEAVSRTRFMLSLFRKKAYSEERDGHMLLVSLLDEAGETHSYRSEISSSLLDIFLKDTPDELAGLNVPPNLVHALLRETENHGLPEPIKAVDEPTLFSRDRLDVRWGDLDLHEDESGLCLSFRLPDSDTVCAITLRPDTHWLVEAQGARRFQSMAYENCPRMVIEGRLGDAPVSGRGWFDHQWGDLGWLRSAGDGADRLRWVWFGITFEDDTDLMICERTNVRTGEVIEAKAIHYTKGAEPVVFDVVRLEQTRCWTSEQTLAVYGVDWELYIPGLELTLAFKPDLDNQEIPIFGLANAIWEGMGTVHGKRGAEAVSGTARMELQGFSYVLDVKTLQARWVERIDTTLRDFLPEVLTDETLERYVGKTRWQLDPAAHTEALSQPVWHLLERGGKHWRPIFGFLMLDAMGVAIAPYERMLATVPELIHNGTVIIDDIEDRSQMRRGEPCLHEICGVSMAINAGNMLYFLPLLTLADHPHLSVSQREDIYKLLMLVFVKAHFGQGQDLHWSNSVDRRDRAFWMDEALGARILQAHAYKTGALLAAISELVCVIAESPPEERIACQHFGENIGVAFQIVDDINNFTKRPEWGKVRGEDLAAGKVSYVIHKAVTLLPDAERSELIALINDPVRRTSPDGLCRGIALVEQSGAFDVCQREAAALIESGWPVMSGILRPSNAKTMLRLLITNLVNIPLET